MSDVAYVMPGGFIAVVGQVPSGFGPTLWRGELRTTDDHRIKEPVHTDTDPAFDLQEASRPVVRVAVDQPILLGVLQRHAEELAITPRYWKGDRA